MKSYEPVSNYLVLNVHIPAYLGLREKPFFWLDFFFVLTADHRSIQICTHDFVYTNSHTLIYGKTCQSPSLIAEHFPGTVTYFTTCSLPPFSVCTFDLLPKSDNVVTFYWIYLHFPKHFLFTSPSSKPLFMYLTYVLSCFGAISSKKVLPAVFMLLSHLTFNFENF